MGHNDTRASLAMRADANRHARGDMAALMTGIEVLRAMAGIPMPPGLDRTGEGLYEGTSALVRSTLNDLEATLRAAIAFYDDQAASLEAEEGRAC